MSPLLLLRVTLILLVGGAFDRAFRRRSAAESRVAVRESRQLSVPVAWGILRPTVVLPESWRSWDGERLQSVLLHELAHLARGDVAVRLLVSAACLPYWFHPGVWYGWRRLRAEGADDTVIREAAMEVWAHLNLWILWPSGGGNVPGAPPITVSGHGHMTLLGGDVEAPMVDVSTVVGPMEVALPAVVRRRLEGAGMEEQARLAGERGGALAEAGAETASWWERTLIRDDDDESRMTTNGGGDR